MACGFCGSQDHFSGDCDQVDIPISMRQRRSGDAQRLFSAAPAPTARQPQAPESSARGLRRRRHSPEARAPRRRSRSRRRQRSATRSPQERRQRQPTRGPPELPVLERGVFPPQPPLGAYPAAPTPEVQTPQALTTNAAVRELLNSLLVSNPGAAMALAPSLGMPPAAPQMSEAPCEYQDSQVPLLDQFRRTVGKLSDEDLLKLTRGDDTTGSRLQKAAYGVPPHLFPDLCFDDPRFKEARALCNAEMMRRCKSLCTPKTRTAVTDNPGEYVPYIMRAQARRNLQKIVPLIPLEADTFNFNVFLTWLTRNSPYTMKKDALPEMIGKIAASLADEGQARLESDGAPAETQLVAPAAIRALAQGCAQPPTQAAAPGGAASARGPAAADALTITLEDLKSFAFDRLHERSGARTLDWALEDRAIAAEDPAPLRTKFESYKTALNALAPKKKGAGKGKPKSQETIDVFKRISESLGVKFDAARLTDVIQLVAAVRARLDEAES